MSARARASQRVEFPGGAGHSLAARLDRPLFEPRGQAVFAHCFTCSKDIAAASRIARALTERGLAVLRFDFTGLGHSEGEFANTDFSSNVEDLVRAADWLRDEVGPPQLLIGHSLGGAAVIAASARIPDALALVTLGAPADPDHVRKLFADQEAEIRQQGEAQVVLGGRPFRIRNEFLEDIAKQRIEQSLAGLRKALLVLHSPIDDMVGIDNASRIFLAARHPKSFVSLDDADHLLTRPGDAAYAARVIAAWAERYLPEPAAAESEPRDVWVRESGSGRFQQGIEVGPHQLIADEPPSVGGNDRGPTPYDLLLAGLGACTTMTLRMYADRKKLPLERVSVRLRHQKIHASDCADCETQGGRLDRIEREISLEGELDSAQQARLLEIADRCPVHRTLESEVSIRTRLDTDAG